MKYPMICSVVIDEFETCFYLAFAHDLLDASFKFGAILHHNYQVTSDGDMAYRYDIFDYKDEEFWDILFIEIESEQNEWRIRTTEWGLKCGQEALSFMRDIKEKFVGNDDDYDEDNYEFDEDVADLISLLKPGIEKYKLGQVTAKDIQKKRGNKPELKSL